MHRDRFRRLVQRALRSLPSEVHSQLDNVAIVVQREPSAEDLAAAGLPAGGELFGLYVGVPLTERTSGYSMTLPDRILIFQGPLERRVPPRHIPAEVASTVRHEIAHHYGMDDPHLERLGLA